MTKVSTIKKPRAEQALVHESEVQRQHIRIQLPAVVKIDKKSHNIVDLSAGGFSIHTDRPFLPSVKTEEVKILFPFENFAFHLKVKAVPVHQDKEKSVVGFRFVETSRRQVSLLNHIIKSYLAGMLMTEDDLIAIASRNEQAADREDMAGNDNYANSKFARIAPMIAIGLAFSLGTFILLGNIYEKTAFVKSYMGKVEGNNFTARAHSDGDFYPLLASGTERVSKNQPIGIVKSNAAPYGTSPASLNSGPVDGAVIKSPCDCLIVGRHVMEGEYVAAGESIYDLQPLDDDMWVTASLPPEQAHRLRLQDSARVRIAGESQFIEGTVAEFLPPSLDRDIAQVKIRPQQPIPYFLADRLAYVEFEVH